MEQTPMTSEQVGHVNKEKRVLDVFKCVDCRRRKVKCAPQSRIWPQKCSECLRLGYNCSPSQRVVRRRRKPPVQTEIHAPNTLNLYPEPHTGAQCEQHQETESQAQHVMNMEVNLHTLEQQVQHYESENTVKKELNELRETCAKQERTIEELLKTVHNIERHMQDMVNFFNLSELGQERRS